MSYELCAEDGLTRRALALRLDVEQAGQADTLARPPPGPGGAAGPPAARRAGRGRARRVGPATGWCPP